MRPISRLARFRWRVAIALRDGAANYLPRYTIGKPNRLRRLIDRLFWLILP